MKIALYVPSWPPGNSPNGIVTYAAQLVPALRHLGHDVFVITPSDSSGHPQTIDLRRFADPPTIWQRAVAKLPGDAAAWHAKTALIASALRHLVVRRVWTF